MIKPLCFLGVIALTSTFVRAQDTGLPDVTEALQQQIVDQSGNLDLAPGRHRITAPLEFDLTALGAIRIGCSRGAATLIMEGAGPAIRIVGSHEGTASPKTVKPETWMQRMPIVEGIEIVGGHPEADGIALIKCLKPTIRAVTVRGCRHGIHLIERNRNVILSDCHLYENHGIGVFFDAVNLHQANLSACHISYNRGGGVVIRDGNVRNVHITGCDIEGNMPGTVDTPTRTANILVDVFGKVGEDQHSIAEIAITGCTIQHSANYGKGGMIAEGGANIRLVGNVRKPIDSVTITGNVLSDTNTNIDLVDTMDIAITGNTFFAPGEDHLHVTRSHRINVTGNTFNPRQWERPSRLIFQDSVDCLVTSNTIRGATATDGALQLHECVGFVVSSNRITESASGIVVEGGAEHQIAPDQVRETRK